jgi:DNA-binding response OmpR family regulator
VEEKPMVALAVGSMGGGRRIGKILVVAPERHIARLVQVNLERIGYEVEIAWTAREAQDTIIMDQPDCLFLDETLPDQDGIALTRKLKGEPATASIRIIMILTFSANEDKAYEAGADYVLTKPFNPMDFTNILRRL